MTDLCITRSPAGHKLSLFRRWPDEWLARERRLTIYAAVLLACLLPMVLALNLDARTLRDANLWIKPIKFALSITILALTTAWFIGHLPTARRNSRAIDSIVWLLIGAGSFELIYISLQAALGEASHYNVGDAFHAAMYNLMGVGALLLTVTQPLLAWQLYRHPEPGRPAARRLSILIGLTLTFVLGAGAGGLLANMQPPSGGNMLPLLGWSMSGGDLRPAHFVGIHAGQVLPLIGLAASRTGMRHATAVVWSSTLAYTALFLVLIGWGLAC